MRALSISSAISAALALLLPLPALAQQYRHPSSCQDGCMTVTAYYDYAGAGAVQDWSCGTQTYDGHRGTDFGTYGSWAAVDEGRAVVAAAEGTVTQAHDGEFDRCTTGSCAGGGGFGNYVAIAHADGKVTYYGHQRQGSIAVGVGDHVTCGQHLGYIASSGYSTGPHLHFEPRVGGTGDDPFGTGGCSGPLVYWVDQGPYRGLPGTTCETPPPPAEVDDATIVSVDPGAGSHVPAASSFHVRLVMHNAGTSTWRDASAYLLTFDGGERMDAPEQVHLSGDVGPGGDTTFEMDLGAPSTPGDYTTYFRMDRFGTARFGDRAEVRVTVDPPADDAAVLADAAAVTESDGGGRDAGPRADGGPARDAGATRDGGGVSRPLAMGCGCHVGASSSRVPVLALAALGLALTARRRRR